jgi:hypothetical protein
MEMSRATHSLSVVVLPMRASRMYRRTLTLRIPVLLMALIVALALMPGEVGESVRAFGRVAMDGLHELGRGYGKLFD